MNDMNDKPYIPWSTPDLEALVREMIARSVEGPKVDRKQSLALTTAAEQVEFAKDVSAIANTDDDAYRDHGFIILGVNKAGVLCGGITILDASTIDNTRAALVDIIKKYIAPVPKFFAYGFNDPQSGPWGVIVIPPSNRQAHIFIKEFSPRPTPGEWFVRVGEVTVKARPEDFVRVFENATRRAVDPLREELRELKLEVRTLRSSLPFSLPRLSETQFALVSDQSHVPPPTPRTTSEVIEHELASPASRIETEILSESLRLASALHKEDSSIPWFFHSSSEDSFKQIIENIESGTRELVRTYGMLARLDTAYRYVDAASQGLIPLTEQKYPSGPFNQSAVNLRLYPVALLLLSTMTVAVSTRNATLPRALLDVPLILGLNREWIEPLAAVFSHVYGASDIFEVAQGREYKYPIANRMRDVVPAWLGDLVRGTSPVDCFYIAEFLLYLACLDAGALPVPGNFMSHAEAHLPVSLFLRRKPEWIRFLFRTELEKLLATFDESMKSQNNLYGFMDRGFKGNTVLAWDTGMDQTKWTQLKRNQ